MARSRTQYALIAVFLVCSQHVLAQDDTVTFSSTVKAPKNSSVDITAEQTKKGSEAADAANPIQAAIDGVHQHIAQALAKVGVTPDRYKALTDPLVASHKNLLSGLDAIRSAYEKTLTSFYGLLLDNTHELRKTLEDGNAVIDNINDLRGAECEDPSFSPPTAKPARITGAAGTFAITTGGCTLTRSAAPLQLDYLLDCTEPGVTFTSKAPRYTSRYVSAAKASTQECTVTRKYGVESTTTITLFDPAAFYATKAKDAGTTAKASSGPADDAGFNKGAAWYQALFPVEGMTGDHISIMPHGVSEAVVKAIKSIKIDATFNYKPYNKREDMQQAAESIAYSLSKSLAVTQKKLKVYKESAEYWLSDDTQQQLHKDLDFKANLKEALHNMNITSMFDGVFAKKASKILAGTPLAGKVGNGKLAAAATAAYDQFTTERPLRTLLHKAREGAGQPVSMKLSASLEQLLNQAGVDGSAGSSLSSTLAKLQDFGTGKNLKSGSLLSLLHKDPQFGQKIKQLADTLSAATSGMKQGFLNQAEAKIAQLSSAANDAKQTHDGIKQNVLNEAEAKIAQLSSAAMGAKQTHDGAKQGLLNAAETRIAQLSSAANGAAQTHDGVMQGLLNAAEAKIAQLSSAANGAKQTHDGIKQGLLNEAEAKIAQLSSAAMGAKQAADGIKQNLLDQAESKIAQLASAAMGAKQTHDGITQGVLNQAEAKVAQLSSAADGAKQAADGIKQGLLDQAEAKIAQMSAATNGVKQGIVNQAEAKLANQG